MTQNVVQNPPLTQRGPGRSGRWMAQPLSALLGLAIIAVITGAAFLPGRAEALTTTITLITFGLPFLVVSSVWWQGWPFRALGRFGSGAVNLLVLAVVALLASGFGQRITGALDVPGLFGTAGAFPIFPYGFVLAASIFVTMLQLTFVCAKVPFDRLPPVWAGFAALATAWVLGTAEYVLLLTWTPVAGTDGPPLPATKTFGFIYALDWPPMLLCIVIMQMTFFFLLDGWPFTAIRSRFVRFVASNVFAIGGGLALNGLLGTLGIGGGVVSAIAGVTAAGTLIQGMLLGGWPFAGFSAAASRLGRIMGAALIATALYLVLHVLGRGYPSGPGVPEVELWIAGTALNLVAASVIVHVAVFRRWPLPIEAPDAG